MQTSIAFHIIGFVLWVGGTMLLARALAVAAAEPAESTGQSCAVKRWAWSGFVGYVVPGAVVTVTTGLIQIFLGGGVAFYFAQGWFHGKVTLIALMLAATVLLGVKASALARGDKGSKGIFMGIHGIAGLTLIGAVLLTIFGRIGSL